MATYTLIFNEKSIFTHIQAYSKQHLQLWKSSNAPRQCDHQQLATTFLYVEKLFCHVTASDDFQQLLLFQLLQIHLPVKLKEIKKSCL